MASKGNRYVLVVEDHFTKFVNLYALNDQTAQSVAQSLFDDYVPLLYMASWRPFTVSRVGNLSQKLCRDYVSFWGLQKPTQPLTIPNQTAWLNV